MHQDITGLNGALLQLEEDLCNENKYYVRMVLDLVCITSTIQRRSRNWLCTEEMRVQIVWYSPRSLKRGSNIFAIISIV